MRSTRILFSAAALFALAACSSTETPTAAPPAVTPSSAVTSASAAASPSAAPDKPLELGQTYRATVGEYSAVVTVLSHKSFDAGHAIEVRTCNRGSAMFNASSVPWRLSYDGGEQLIDVTIDGGGLPSPALTERELQPGKCARGWISFEADAGSKPDGAEYHAEGAPSARWEW